MNPTTTIVIYMIGLGIALALGTPVLVLLFTLAGIALLALGGNP